MAVVGFVGSAACMGCGVFWRSPASLAADAPADIRSRILSSREVARVDSVSPQLLESKRASSRGEILVFGMRHTRDPNDSQIKRLHAEWARFRPTVALVEGRLGFLMRGVMDPVGHYGESGATVALAKGDGVRVHTWEPTQEDEAKSMLARFPAKRVALYLTLRPYFGNLRFGKPSDPDAVVDKTRTQRTRLPGLESSLSSVATIDSIWRTDFAGRLDWRDTSDEFGLPGYLEDLFDAANRARDEHLVGLLAALSGKGERVFATVGLSHVAKIRGAVEALH